jgi:electron transfer flavoprotein alpha subunit
MSNDVFVLVEHSKGVVADTAYELCGKAKELAATWGGRAVALVIGEADASDVGADVVLMANDPALAEYTSDAYLQVLSGIVTERDPKLVLVPNTTVGMDVGAGLAAMWGRPLAAYCIDVAAEQGDVVATAQIYGGKLLAEAVLDGGSGVCSVLAGSFPAAPGRGTPGSTEQVAASVQDVATTFLSLISPEGGDVDITASDVLVSIGRGIGSADNVELAQEFADAVGAAVSASRPVTDAGWLPKTRQVGKSGLKVKPKAYLAFGISGAPEHLEGMRDAELIIACNTDENAPIFDVAHYGTTVDLFDLLPELAEQVG